MDVKWSLCKARLCPSLLGVSDRSRRSGNCGQLCLYASLGSHSLSSRTVDREEEVYPMARCQWLSTSPLPGVLFVFHRLQLVHPHRDGSVLWKQYVLWMQTALGSEPPSAKRRLLHSPLPVTWSWNKITWKVPCVWPLSDKCPWLWPPLYWYVCFLPFSWCKGRWDSLCHP